uniref:Lipase n=1 Tax=Rhabditophanes sp. KR3021 TaxID=114890 RepID=A0AC35TMF4_9BILA
MIRTSYFLVLLVACPLESSTLGPITRDFQVWLEKSFARTGIAIVNPTYLNNASFGGRLHPNQKIFKTPIVFVHGNSDGALKNIGNPFGTGWDESVNYFIKQGYSLAELFGITYGDRIPSHALERTFNCKTIIRMRAFFKEVIKYTRSQKIHIIAHSMGVTISRKAIKGGLIQADDGKSGFGNCDIGPSISDKIDTLISISAANYGVCFCQLQTFRTAPGCNQKNGFWPGALNNCEDRKSIVNVTDYSSILKDINENPVKEAHKIYVILTENDEIIGNKGKVFGRYTSSIPTMDEEYVFETLKHMETKDNTTELQYCLIQKHSCLNIPYFKK